MISNQSKFLLYQWILSLLLIFIGLATKMYHTSIFGGILLVDFWLTVYAHKK